VYDAYEPLFLFDKDKVDGPWISEYIYFQAAHQSAVTALKIPEARIFDLVLCTHTVQGRPIDSRSEVDTKIRHLLKSRLNPLGV